MEEYRGEYDESVTLHLQVDHEHELRQRGPGQRLASASGTPLAKTRRRLHVVEVCRAERKETEGRDHLVFG